MYKLKLRPTTYLFTNQTSLGLDPWVSELKLRTDRQVLLINQYIKKIWLKTMTRSQTEHLYIPSRTYQVELKQIFSVNLFSSHKSIIRFQKTLKFVFYISLLWYYLIKHGIFMNDRNSKSFLQSLSRVYLAYRHQHRRYSEDKHMHIHSVHVFSHEKIHFLCRFYS